MYKSGVNILSCINIFSSLISGASLLANMTPFTDENYRSDPQRFKELENAKICSIISGIMFATSFASTCAIALLQQSSNKIRISSTIFTTVSSLTSITTIATNIIIHTR